MSSSLQNQNAIFGVTAGLYPTEKGPLVLRVPVPLVLGTPMTLDFHEEIANGAIDFIQSVFMDNNTGTSPLSLTVSLTGQNIVCPSKSQGVFTLMMPPGGTSMSLAGPTGNYVLLFSNMPFAPAVWSAQ